MTQNELLIINAINVNGLDNGMWGVVSVADWDVVELHGATCHYNVPPHIYVYRECEECSLINEVTPDYTLRTEGGEVIDLYYLTQEGGEE